MSRPTCQDYHKDYDDFDERSYFSVKRNFLRALETLDSTTMPNIELTPDITLKYVFHQKDYLTLVFESTAIFEELPNFSRTARLSTNDSVKDPLKPYDTFSILGVSNYNNPKPIRIITLIFKGVEGNCGAIKLEGAEQFSFDTLTIK